jgi:tRNA(Ile)-lysidine synthase
MLPVKKFTEFSQQNNLFHTDSKILAAISGGMDSVVMAHLLKASGLNFSIAHCNFQLRGDEAIRDQEFCNELARQFRVKFHTINFDTSVYAVQNKISIQMAARDLRYRWFEQLREQQGYDVIALAHHQNDTIETILLNLTRGTGIAGLHGILPRSGHLVRPLLFLGRDEVREIVEENGLKYVEDSSNASTKYARNKLRHEVIPKLKELNPSLEKTFENSLQHFRDMETLLELRVEELKQELFTENGDEIHIALAGLKKLEPKRLLLFKLLQDYGFNEATITDIIESLDKHAGRVFESDRFRLILDREKLILTKRRTDQLQKIQLNEGEHEVTYGNYRVTVLHDDSPLIIKDNPLATAIDSELLVYPLTIRPWQQSDYFYPLGMKTRKKLSDFFIQKKIPLHEKSTIPLLVNGNGDIMWIAGHRLSDRYKVSAKTKKVTIFELFKMQ